MQLVIYRILNLKTKRVYIGSTGNFEASKAEHFGQLRKNKHCNSFLQADFRIYKEANFAMDIIQDGFKTRDAMLLREYELILKNKGGYNMHTDCPVVSGSDHKNPFRVGKHRGFFFGNKRTHSKKKSKPIVTEHPVLDKIANRKRIREILKGRNDD